MDVFLSLLLILFLRVKRGFPSQVGRLGLGADSASVRAGGAAVPRVRALPCDRKDN